MSFSPLKEKGIPIEKQLRSWSELNVKPYNKNTVHPYTRVRIIFMNGIEVEAAMFKHQWARHTDDLELKKQIALSRRVEQQQQKAVNWLIPANESGLEVTIGYEQVAVDLTAFLAQTEPDPYVKAALDFALLEDFDHLYRYANLLTMVNGKSPHEITGPYTEITVGRPTMLEHRHPFDEVRRHYDAKSASPLTKLHVETIIAAEQQTMNFYMNIGNRPLETVGRGLYLEIAQIEEQHVTHYESLADPRCSWFEMAAQHELNECWLYWSLMQEEPDKYVKGIWETHLAMEVEHFKMACELMKKHEKRDPAEIFPETLPDPLSFRSNVDYVRKVLEEQVDLQADGTEFVEELPEGSRYFMYQDVYNAGGAPSELVIEERISQKGTDYRQELKGPHPISRYRQPSSSARAEESQETRI